MAKVREILRHVCVEVAARRRICHRNRAEHSIAQGEACLVIRDGEMGGSKNYCSVCATDILARAESDLVGLRRQMASPA